MDELEKLETMTKAPTGANEPTLKAWALANLSPEYRERLVADAASIGVTRSNDVTWILLGSVVESAAAALASSDAAQAVSQSVQKIPDQIYHGTVLAGEDLQHTIEAKGVEIGQALVHAVGTAGTGVVGCLKTVFLDAESRLKAAADKIIDDAEQAKTDTIASGVDEFARIARSAIVAEVRALTWRSRVITAVIAAGLMLTSAVGGVLVAKLDGHVTDYRIQQTVDGREDCGTATIVGVGRQYVCVIRQIHHHHGVRGFFDSWF